MNPLEEMYLPIKKVADRYTSSTRKIYRLIEEEDGFPKPVQIGGTKKWALSDLVKFEEELRKRGDKK